MRKKRYQASKIAGIITLAFVLIVLIAAPSSLFSPVATFIDTELYNSSGHETFVNTLTDFGDPVQMEQFPRVVGKWEGSDYPVSEYVKLLGAEIMLVRGYEPSTFTQPVFLVIVQAKTESSFHPPKVCATAQGDTIQEEGQENIQITAASWIKDAGPASVPMKKLVVAKLNKKGEITERRILLFCYVKGNQFYSDTITMIQMEALAPLSGSYDGALTEMKDFVAQAMPSMFSPAKGVQSRPLALAVLGWGVRGYALLAVLLLVPLGMIAYSRFGPKGGSKAE